MGRARQTEILIRNESFYTALSTGDLAAMEGLWASEMHVSCIHPGGGPLFGREAVMESWVRILSSPAGAPLQCLEPKIHLLSDDLALVVCFERFGGDTLTATNIFALENTNWVLLHHQSGPLVGAVTDIPVPRLLQ